MASVEILMNSAVQVSQFLGTLLLTAECKRVMIYTKFQRQLNSKLGQL